MSPLDTPITRGQLIEAIRQSINKMTILVPDSDYYARSTDFSRTDLEYICPDSLITAIDLIGLNNDN